MTSKVSIIMAAYNAADFIQEAITSLKQQTYPNWEVLVVDDASKDDTAMVVQRLAEADPRIRLIRSPKNGGPGAARNLGLAAATGEWVTVLDCDDKYVSTRLEKLVHFAEQNNLDVVADNHLLYNLSAGKIFGQGFYAHEGSYPLTPELLVLNDCPGQWFPFGLLKPFMRRSALQAHGLHYPNIRLGEDFFLFFSLLVHSRGKAALLSEPLYIYMPQIHSDRSQTIINAEAWNNYRAVCRQYLLDETERYDRDNKKLVAAIMKRDASLARYIVWCHMRDPTRKGAFLRQWLVFFCPFLWPMVGVVVRRMFTRKHGIPSLTHCCKGKESCASAIHS